MLMRPGVLFSLAATSQLVFAAVTPNPTPKLAPLLYVNGVSLGDGRNNRPDYPCAPGTDDVLTCAKKIAKEYPSTVNGKTLDQRTIKWPTAYAPN